LEEGFCDGFWLGFMEGSWLGLKEGFFDGLFEDFLLCLVKADGTGLASLKAYVMVLGLASLKASDYALKKASGLAWRKASGLASVINQV
jgi:hypothetical protein